MILKSVVHKNIMFLCATLYWALVFLTSLYKELSYPKENSHLLCISRRSVTTHNR